MPRITINVPGLTAQPYRIDLDRPLITFGRGNDNDVVIASNSVSTCHAELKRTRGGYTLNDVGSTNGIIMDDVRHMSLPIVNDSTVYMGDASVHFFLTEEELAVLNTESPASAGSPLFTAPSTPSTRDSSTSSTTGNLATFLVILILAVLTFFTGLALRHQKETGGSLIKSMMGRLSAK